ncbi:ISAs1 family transposase [Phormidesmis priestleyi ULC007]|uniref:ISAs1 family transposase n=1 Tax=Phormidesmis priestleyi ULC007 TaxID=1920490 RepID=A0A2T1D2J6_9CYAN|nr:ISAs1 family transposase [Phormidesmis priestleyi]PSB14700.1 ISAs1 family transposase [Phormidesmis priestleyi ULC007]
MNSPTDARILSHFADLDDPRNQRGKDHRLLDIVAIAICAVICGAESWVDIELYGQSKQEWLGTFLSLNKGIPSHDTFARVFARLDPDQMQACFISWIRAISQLSAGEVIAIDGKTVRHSYDRANGKGAIHMVSAWASANRLVLGQRKVDEKSNEITAIPQLLQVLAIEGCIVTIDAMGTQKEIASVIIDKGADYILALKGNQGGLFEDVQWLFEQAQATQFQEVAHDFAQTIDKGHGRTEIRRCWTLSESELDYLVQKSQWKGLQTVVMLQSERRVNGQVSTESRYYISSLASHAAKIAAAIRTPWMVENHLHWVLDVSFNEDACRIRKDHAPQNLSLLRHIALNLLGQDQSTKVGIAAKRKKAGWDDAYLLRILAL